MSALTIGWPHRLGSRFFFEGSSCAHFVLQSYHGRGRAVAAQKIARGVRAIDLKALFGTAVLWGKPRIMEHRSRIQKLRIKA
jgi:hypothetical protein